MFVVYYMIYHQNQMPQSSGNKGQNSLSSLRSKIALFFSKKLGLSRVFSTFSTFGVWTEVNLIPKQNNFKWLYSDPLTLMRVKVSGFLTSWGFLEKNERYSAAAIHPGEFIWYCEK